MNSIQIIGSGYFSNENSEHIMNRLVLQTFHKCKDTDWHEIETDNIVCACIDPIAKLRGDEYNLSNSRVHTPTRRHRMMPSIGMVSNYFLFA